MRQETDLAIKHISTRVQHDLVGDDLDLSWLEGVLQVELGVLRQRCKCPVKEVY